MSGPTTAIYESTPVLSDAALANLAGLSAVVLAARAIQEAQTMQREYQDIQAEMLNDLRAQHAQRVALRQAGQQRVQQQHVEAERLLGKWQRMQSVLKQPQATPSLPPAGASAEVWTEFIARLQQAVQQLEQHLAQVQVAEVLLEDAPDTAQLLTAYAQQRARDSQLTGEQVAHYRALSLHVLARLELPAGAPLPTRLDGLARTLVQAQDVAHAEALAADLRREVQYANQQWQQQQADRAQAEAWLADLGEALPAELAHLLQAVAAGTCLLDDATRQQVAALLQQVQAERQREEQAAMGVVLQQSLRDLGYEVEDIAETLFMQGGLVHFQQADWGDYFVRLRVNPANRSVNFNMVRANTSAERDARQDYLAEDRWCSKVPKLMQTLAARGLNLEVTRRLEAGEVPVQLVDPTTLPAARQAEETPQTALRSRQMPN